MIKVIIKAKFIGIKPAHHAYIDVIGEGGSWAVAVCDGMRKISKHDWLKGKRASNILPGTFTISTFAAGEVTDEQ